MACAGVGKANDADYVGVSRSLVCRVPKGCDLKLAAETPSASLPCKVCATPLLSNTAHVIGLEWIGQITVQLLPGYGDETIGLELDPQRVAKTMNLGMEAGAPSAEFYQLLVGDHLPTVALTAC